MPILVVCDGCQRRFSAPDHGAGRRVPCPYCRATITIPATPVEDDLLLPAAAPPSPPPRYWSPPTTRASAPPIPPAPVRCQTPAPPAPQETISSVLTPPTWVPATKSSTPVWLRHLHWCLALAMIPLAMVVLVPGESEEELIARLERAVQSAREARGDDALDAIDPVAEINIQEMTLDEVLAQLPGKRLEGALLSRSTWWHWGFAILSVAAYMTFFIFLASDGSARAWHLLGVGAFVATFGILLLMIVQAASTIGLGGDGPEALVRMLLTLIGLSYRAALDPEIGFVGSFVGFTLGVGLCEEMCKALPLFLYYRFNPRQNWRGAFLWGLAAGAGFGVAEGIIYSQDFYNGIVGPGIYLVRFVSCVALHAVWTGTIGIAINRRQGLLQWDPEQWWRMPIGIALVIAGPMVLHGLYDTMLKKELDLLALVVAAASFGYLAWTISRLRTSDDEDERAAYVANYIRRNMAGTRAE